MLRENEQMLRKYLLLLIPLLLFNFATSLANNNSKDSVFLSNIYFESFENSPQEIAYSNCTPYNQNNRNLLFSEDIEIENTEESEKESSSKKIKNGNQLVPTFLHQNTKYNLYISLEKSIALQYYFKNTSVKLHLKFQVFII